jgi:hypothetical protein
MRLRACAIVAAFVLAAAPGVSWGMGSGPHPHLLNEIPPDRSPGLEPTAEARIGSTVEVVMLGGCLVGAGLLAWAMRAGQRR